MSPEFVVAGGSTTALSSGGASGKSLSCPTMPSIDDSGESPSPPSAADGCASTALSSKPTSPSSELVGFASELVFATHFSEALLAA